MTNYPNGQDNNITLPGVSGTSEEDIAINALRDATIAIEKELGVVPSGPYSDVRARFDILEARINNPVSPVILDDGYVNSPLFIVNTPASVTLSVSVGTGMPTENRVDGSLYLRTDGTVAQGLYSRRNGQWVQVTTDPFVASGDLSGTYLSQTVVGIQGKPLRSTLTSIGATQDGYHLTWNNGDGYWEAQTGFVAGGDLTAGGAFFGRRNQRVSGFQGRPLSSNTPGGTTASDGDVYAWNNVAAQWQPQPRAIIFDGYSGRTNLRSNKLLQSPIDTTKVGIVNFGSRSIGTTAGTTADYSAILSGDRGVVSGTYGVMVGGDTNTISGQYGFVGNGINNTATTTNATVVNGNTNAASQTYAAILDGYNNTASALASFVLNGGNNAPAAPFSGVLNGLGNTISSASTHAGIGFGSTNQIAGTSTYTVLMGGSGNTVTGPNNFVGVTTGTTVTAGYSAVVVGLANSIGAGSTHSVIVSGNTNQVAASGNYALIGSGSSNSATGNYVTVVNGSNNTSSGNYSLILNGATNSVTGTSSWIANGNNNTITGLYGFILDGYTNQVTANFSSVLGGYSQTISGVNSSVLNGNGNTIASSNSTVLNGSTNSTNAGSSQITILAGGTNGVTDTTHAIISGTGNTLSTANNSLVFGGTNNVQAPLSMVVGTGNTVGASGSINRVFGNSNNLGTSSVQNTILGSSNILTGFSTGNLVSGSTNILTGANNSMVFGSNNIASASFSSVTGQYGKSRMFGQQVTANSRFGASNIGEAQASKLILTGAGAAGAAITLQLQDPGGPVNMSFVDGYSYEMNIRVLIVNTAPISPNPVVPARYVFDVLAHAEGGILVVDNINLTLSTPQSSGTPWTVSVSGWGALPNPTNNEFVIQVDTESGPPYVQPSNTPSSRRAIATVEMREISRI